MLKKFRSSRSLATTQAGLFKASKPISRKVLTQLNHKSLREKISMEPTKNPSESPLDSSNSSAKPFKISP
jgi:hypothetical protein